MRVSHGFVLALMACVAVCGMGQCRAARDAHSFAAVESQQAEAASTLVNDAGADVSTATAPSVAASEPVAVPNEPAAGERIARDMRSVAAAAAVQGAEQAHGTADVDGGAGPHAFQLQPLWPQPFHSTRNAGQSIVHGPLGPGSCPTDLIPNSINQASYFHTGVLSLDNQRLYVGSSLNVFYIVNITTQNLVAVDLGGGNRIQGIVASPVVAKYGPEVNGFQAERVYVASADAHVYALDPVACQTQDQTGCIVWSQELDQPALGPLHQTFHGVNAATQPYGVLYASTSSNVSDTNAAGRLYSLDCQNGKVLNMLAATSIDTKSTYPIHAAVAVDNCDNSPFQGVVYIPFGHRIVALDPADFSVIAELTPNDTVTNDPFQSSLSMGPNCQTLFVQSRSKRVWRINITGTDLTKMQLSLQWRCSYTTTESHCCVPPWCTTTYADNLADFDEPQDGTPATTNVFSTPAFNDFNGQVVVAFTDPYIPSPDQVGGVFSIDAHTGLAVKRLTEYSGVSFGQGRSSAVIDPAGAVYIGSDSLNGETTVPVLYALTSDLEVMFVSLLADSGAFLGAASPLLAQTLDELGTPVPWVITSGGDKIRSLQQGVVCPSASLNPLEPCSNNGACNCQTGECACFDDCFVDGACAVFNDCNGHGFCNKGLCDCEVCYGPPECAASTLCGSHGTCTSGPTGQSQCSCDACYGGFNCLTLETCSGHGTCVPGENGAFTCHCDGGFHGNTCDTANPGSPSGGNGAVVAVVVIVLILMVAVALWLLMQWRTGRGLFKATPRMRRSQRTLDVIYETEEEHSSPGSSRGLAGQSKTYGSTYTSL